MLAFQLDLFLSSSLLWEGNLRINQIWKDKKRGVRQGDATVTI